MAWRTWVSTSDRCPPSIMGPISVAASVPGPTRMALAQDTSSSMKVSATSRCT
jgi:hypothetical protein